jgi:hypothetical protein
MDSLNDLYQKYIKALLNEATYMLDTLQLTAYDLLQMYEEAKAANSRGDTVWRDQILKESYSIYVS